MSTLPKLEHEIVSAAEWLEARRQLLAQETELTKFRDRVSAARRRRPCQRPRQ